MSQGAKLPTLQKSSQTSSRNLSSTFLSFVSLPKNNLLHSIIKKNLFFLLSNPACTDIMEIYNAVEEMDDDDEVCLTELIYLFIMSCCQIATH